MSGIANKALQLGLTPIEDISKMSNDKKALLKANLQAAGFTLPNLPGNGVAALGDSFVFYEYNVEAGKSQLSSRGALVWANVILGGRLTIRQEWMRGVVGNKTNQILDRVSEITALPARYVFLTGWINDLNDSYSLTDSIAYKKATIDALLAMGRIVIAEPVLPRTIWSILTGQQIIDARRKMDGLNRWLRAYARTVGGLHVTNADKYVMDRSTAQDNAFTSPVPYPGDGVHYFTLGSYHRGRALAEILGRLIPPTVVGTFRQHGVFDPINNPYGNLLTNGQMVGSTSTANPGTSGVTPTNWTMARTFGSTVTGVGSKVTESDGGQSWTVSLGASGTGSTGELIRLRAADINAGTDTYTSGDKIKAFAEVEWSNLTNIQAVYLSVADHNGTMQVMDVSGPFTSGLSSDRMPATVERVMFETPLLTVSPYSGSGTQRITASIYIQADCSVTAPSGTVKVHNVDVSKSL